jgi:dienelactone hydrolase
MNRIFLWAFFCSSFNLQAQDTFHFTKGLIVRVPYTYGREALYTDPLAFKLYTNTLRTPAEGVVFDTTESKQGIWQPIVADSLFRLRRGGRNFGERRLGTYLYLTYSSDKEQAALLNIKGNSGVYVNGEPHMSDPYGSGYLYIPIKLKKGLNEFYVRGGSIIASLAFPDKPIFINTEDVTLPHVRLGAQNDSLKGAVVIYNITTKELKGLQLKSKLQSKEAITSLPTIPAMSSRKIFFGFNASDIQTKGDYECILTLMDKAKSKDETKLKISAVEPTEQYSKTFVSDIDGSLQYYSVVPQLLPKPKSALFLSVHGAGVEAIGQARAYASKDWGTIVTATNRRPRGFNWEDWGRLDALEVLNLAKEEFQPDPKLIYLTGHSMGGHGTWFLGATYPDKWAAIGAAAGYPTLKGYGSADGLIPDTSTSPVEQILLRSSNQSDIIKLATNYKPLGVYILHGDSDKVVSVNYARQMKKVLSDFQPDYSYYEYPGGEHWFGNQSVDWKPMFEYFKWHSRKEDSLINNIDFITANPGISSSYYWASIYQQKHPLQYSHLRLNRNRAKNTITGATTNIRLLKLDLEQFGSNATLKINLDSSDNIEYTTKNNHDSIFLLKENNRWKIAAEPSLTEKGPHRYGTFKDAFNHRMIFIYGTKGTKEENEWSYNKARYDAETWYYRGNGAVDIIPDKEFSLSKYKDRGVILFGNKNTNAAWSSLLQDCPIQVERLKISVGNKVFTGDDLGTYFVWPLQNSSIASVAVVGGSGIKGMKAVNANQYFAGASGFPDFMIFTLNMLQSGKNEVKIAGFFDNDWKLDKNDLEESK